MTPGIMEHRNRLFQTPFRSLARCVSVIWTNRHMILFNLKLGGIEYRQGELYRNDPPYAQPNSLNTIPDTATVFASAFLILYF